MMKGLLFVLAIIVANFYSVKHLFGNLPNFSGVMSIALMVGIVLSAIVQRLAGVEDQGRAGRLSMPSLVGFLLGFNGFFFLVAWLR